MTTERATQPAGGTAQTLQDNRKPFGVSPGEAIELNIARRCNQQSKADGYLAIMLVGRANWTRAQTAAFLGMTERSVNDWCDAFAGGAITDLRNMPDPEYTHVPASPDKMP